MPYDCIIFCNVPYDAFGVDQLQGLKEAVYNVGVGFMMVGGKNSFGAGGWNRTVAEEILPVTMDISNKKVLPKKERRPLSYTRANSRMAIPGRHGSANRPSKFSGRRPKLGMLAYDYQNGEDWLFELTPAGKYEELVPLIDGAQIGDMPSFQSTMELGLAGLQRATRRPST